MWYQLWLKNKVTGAERSQCAWATDGDKAMAFAEDVNPEWDCYRWKKIAGMALDNAPVSYTETKRYEVQLKDVKDGYHFNYTVYGNSIVGATYDALSCNPTCEIESCREVVSNENVVRFEPNMVDFCSDRRELSDKIRGLKEDVARLKGLVRELQLHVAAKAEYLGVVNDLNDDYVREIEHLRACIKMMANEPY